MEAHLEVESMTQLPSPPRYWGSAQMLGMTTSLRVEYPRRPGLGELQGKS